MFASYICYQIVDLFVALVLIRFVDRWLRGPSRVLQARCPRLLGTAFRRWALLVVPVAILGTGVVAWIAQGPLQRLVGGLAHSFGLGPVSVKFMGIGVAFYAWLLLLPLEGLRRALRGTGAADGGAPTSRRSGGLERAVAALACAVGLGLVVESVALEPRRVQVVETYVPIAGWPEGLPPMRVVVLADIQSSLLTDRERSLPALVESLRPDLIVLPGDLMGQSLDDDLPIASARYVTERLNAPLGSFAVNGDVDPFVEGGVAACTQGTRVVYLDNASVVVKTPSGPTVEVAGFDPQRPGEYREVVRRPRRGDLRIAVVHRPRHGEEIAWASSYDLVIAGHTHGGQVVVPGFGPPITASPLPRDVAAGGLAELSNGTPLYVSRGIGLEAGFAPPIRFQCPPEVSLLILGPALAEGPADGPAPADPSSTDF